MKNTTAILTFTSAVLLSVPFGKFISKVIDEAESKRSKSIIVNGEVIDMSLRNFHPNKGE